MISLSKVDINKITVREWEAPNGYVMYTVYHDDEPLRISTGEQDLMITNSKFSDYSVLLTLDKSSANKLSTICHHIGKEYNVSSGLDNGKVFVNQTKSTGFLQLGTLGEKGYKLNSADYQKYKRKKYTGIIQTAPLTFSSHSKAKIKIKAARIIMNKPKEEFLESDEEWF